MLTEREYTQAAERYLDMVYRIALNSSFLRKGIGPSSARKVLFRRTRRRKSN